jgi:hypothetical protein
MKDRCCPNTLFRKIARSVYEAAREEAKRIATTPAYKQSRRERKKVVYRLRLFGQAFAAQAASFISRS